MQRCSLVTNNSMQQNNKNKNKCVSKIRTRHTRWAVKTMCNTVDPFIKGWEQCITRSSAVADKQLSLTNRAMPVCKFVEVVQEFL